MPMPPMLAYTLMSSMTSAPPYIVIDVGRKATRITPANPVIDSYWFVFLDVKNPRVKAKELVVPGNQHGTVPPGLEADLSNPNYIFAVVTHELAIPYVPQGPFYDLLSKFGAGRELQRLEQQSAAIPCGGYSVVSYVLTAPGGPRTPPNPAPPSYEIASNEGHSALLLMSLMESAGGGGPYSLMDSYTWTSPP